MDERTKAICDAKAKVLKALAHPSRVFIVEELARGEQCVCRLVDQIGVDFSTVSKHLAVLKQAGIVEDESRGRQVYYRLRVPCVLRFMDCIEAVIEPGAGSRVEGIAETG
jgi:DNA-binding transcriptional ArsR family regulator